MTVFHPASDTALSAAAPRLQSAPSCNAHPALAAAAATAVMTATALPTAHASDPWSSAGQADASASAASASSSADPWGGSAGTTAPVPDWASAAPAADAPQDAPGFVQQLLTGELPVEQWINHGLGWLVEHLRPFFQSIRAPIDATLGGVEHLLLLPPWPVLTALIALLAWQFAGRGMAVGAALAMLAIALLGIWQEAMVTLALVLTSLVFCIAIGLPLGIALAASDRAQRWMRPVLDAMQTTPAFVYLVPVVMLFGIGNVPGVIVTIIFAVAPLVRLTSLGIRQVRPDLIEASRAYGASPWQMLLKVQLPLAMPSIMAGINQALMLSLSMVVIASMIAVGGLGQMVLRGIGRLDMGLATVGGLGIVLLAIVLDRITQALGQPRRGHARWWHTGPLGLILKPRRPSQATTAPAADTAP